jgi:hypothetical protein
MGSLEIAREIAHKIVLEEAKRAGLASYTQPVTRKTRKQKRRSNKVQKQAAVLGRSVSRRHVNHARKQHRQPDGLRPDSGVAARSRKAPIERVAEEKHICNRNFTH